MESDLNIKTVKNKLKKNASTLYGWSHFSFELEGIELGRKHHFNTHFSQGGIEDGEKFAL
jgi:hypothetical protein